MKIIYRKSDKLVVGYIYPTQKELVELLNITQSELGGAIEDYDTVNVDSIPPSHKAVIQPDGTATFELDTQAIEAQKEAVLKRPEVAAIMDTMETLIVAIETEFPRARGTIKARMGGTIREIVKNKL